MGPIRTRLEGLVESGEFERDPAQMDAADLMDSRLEKISNFRRSRLSFGPTRRTPKGLYLWGGVGRGKSLLMDWFFELAENKRKSRVHFHAFMIDVHARIGAWRKLSKSERRASENYVRGAGDDPIAPVAKAIARDATLLCFDEFHVTDITDAMILSRLFSALWDRQIIVIATSNRDPDDLYESGLNRNLFLPFIEILKDNMIVHEFAGDIDHRLRQLRVAPVYYTPLGKTADLGMEQTWQRLTASSKEYAEVLHVQGRELVVPRVSAGAARLSFADVCMQPLGAADYLKLARTYHTVLLEGVPRMDKSMRNEAKRFVTFIDALYETRTKLVVSADVSPDALYTGGTGAFEFERTASRLMEMKSETYLAAARIGADGEGTR